MGFTTAVKLPPTDDRTLPVDPEGTKHWCVYVHVANLLFYRIPTLVVATFYIECFSSLEPPPASFDPAR
jgi:hypothetical protein